MSSNSSLFGTQTKSVFGQTNNGSNNPFAPKPSGTSTPFGAQTGSSMFGGTSTGAFGAPQPSSPFGAASQAFGSSTPAFGASSAPAFGSSASPFGGSSTFGQKSFGISKPHSSLFGSSTQQSQPAFGNSTFGSSTPFGASSTLAFGASSTPAFGASSTPAFGAFSTPAFGASSMPAFGASNTSAFGVTTTPTLGATGTLRFGTTSTPGFGATSTPVFGVITTPGFGVTSTPGFGASSTPGFGTSSIPAFGSTSTPAFGASSTPSFGASSSPALGASSSQPFGSSGTPLGINAFGSGGGFGGSSTSVFGSSSTPGFGASNTSTFGASSTPSFSFGSSPAFGPSTSAFGSGSFGSAQSPFGSQGAHPSTSTFGGQSTNRVQQGGSRVMPYAPTTEADSGTGKPQSISAMGTGKLQSVSAMSVYKEKNHEELRWEDYQQGDKGGKLPVGQSPGGTGFGVTNPQPSIFSPSPTFGPTTANPANPFSSSIATNSFAQKTPTTFPKFSSPFGQSSTPSCGQTTTPSFGHNTTPSIFVSSTSSNTISGFGPSPGFATATSQPMGSLNVGSASSHGFTTTFSTGGNFSNSHSSPLFSSNPSSGQNTTPVFEQTSSAFGQNTNPVFGQTNNLNAPSAGFGNPSSSSSSLTTSISPFGQTMPVGLTPNPSVQPAQPSSGAFGFNNFGQTQIGNTIGVTGGMGSFSLGNFGSASANTVVMQPPVTNPFGTLPASRQISISQGGNLSSIQYGISSMPVVDKPISVRGSPLLTSRHLQQRRVRLPTRKYRPDDDGPKVPFFSNLDENSSKPKADVLFIRRENPRALLIRPVERLRSEDPKDGLTSLHENDKPDKNNGETPEAPPVKPSQKPNMTYENHRGDTNGSHSTSPSGVDIESLMPKLHHPEYFTEPRIQQLATKEKVDPGYCKRVKDFVVGRHGYGSIKFLGETDVSRLDLEMSVRFGNREVFVYMDESKKPPVGEGLNKPALVTLLNIKCKDKKSGRQVKEGERLDKYKEMLKKKAEEQGAKFVSYDAVNGVWTFKVEHF